PLAGAPESVTCVGLDRLEAKGWRIRQLQQHLITGKILQATRGGGGTLQVTYRIVIHQTEEEAFPQYQLGYQSQSVILDTGVRTFKVSGFIRIIQGDIHEGENSVGQARP